MGRPGFFESFAVLVDNLHNLHAQTPLASVMFLIPLLGRAGISTVVGYRGGLFPTARRPTGVVGPFVSGARSVHGSIPVRGGCWMLDAWMSALMLAIESNNVVELRLLKIAGGGSDAYAEASLMVREKIAAAFEAQEAMWSEGLRVR